MDRRLGARNIARRYSRLVEYITDNYPCANCGVPAGKPCLPEYGCDEFDRLVPERTAVLIPPLRRRKWTGWW